MLTKLIVQKIAPWFLYIFIDPAAKLPAEIMQKRAKQLAVLQLIDKVSLFANMEQLINWVEEGIKQKYGRTPGQVLNILYLEALAKNKTKIGSNSITLGEDGRWYDSVTGELYSDSTANLSKASGGDFWLQLKEIIEWIVSLLKQLGITKPDATLNGGTANSYDWDNIFKNKDKDKTEAGIGDAVPYIVGGVLLYYLFTKTKK